MNEKNTDSNGNHFDLIEKYVLGCISEGEFAQLQQLLRDDPALRKQLASSLDLDTLLRSAGLQVGDSNANANADNSLVAIDPPDRRQSDLPTGHGTPRTNRSESALSPPASNSRTPTWNAFVMVALTLACMILLFFAFWNSQHDGGNVFVRSVGDPPTTAGTKPPVRGTTIPSLPLGMITSLVSYNSQSALVDSRPREVFTKSLELESGVHEIVLTSGIVLTVTGPAKIQLESPTEFRVTDGTIEVISNGMSSVSVLTPELKVTVEDGDFEIKIDSQDERVQVLRGTAQVQALRRGKDLKFAERQVQTERAVTYSTLGRFQPAKYAPSVQRDLAAFNKEQIPNSQIAEGLWRQQNLALDDDDQLLVHFGMQPKELRFPAILTSRSAVFENLKGVIFGSEWSAGRWPWKHSLDFKGLKQHVLFDLDGEHESLTLFASVRIDALNWPFQAIVNSDDWSERRLHWQIRNDEPELGGAMLELGVSIGDLGGESFTSVPIIDSATLGHWITLATTVDCHSGTVKHYLNGNLVSKHKMSNRSPIRVDRSRIGNSYTLVEIDDPASISSDESISVRPFNGRMDDLMIFSRVLSPEEIVALSQLEFDGK